MSTLARKFDGWRMVATTVITYGSGLTVMDNHISGLTPGGPGYTPDCNDSDARTCGNVIVGPIPDGYFLNPPGSKANSPMAGLSASLSNAPVFVT